MAIDFVELKVRICEALGHLSGVSVDANGFYYCECDKDYRDELEDSQIADILAGRHRYRVNGVEHVESMEPMDALNTLLADGYQEEMWRIEDEVLDEAKKHADVASFIEENGIDDDCLRECLRDVWYVRPPVDDYLKQDVCMDIMLDTGDRNYEFTCNNLASSDIQAKEDFDGNSSLLWLCEQQGVTREELLEAFDKGTAHSDEVVGLRDRKAVITAELQGFGFAAPRFAERVWHTGAYQEYARLQAQLVKLSKEIQSLTEKRQENSLNYQDYLKQHFDRFERLDPMTEEMFKIKQAEILGHFDAKLEAAAAEYSKVKDRLDFGTDYRRIAILTEEHRSIQWQLGDLEKTDEYQKAEFIDSVCKEVHNMSSHMGAVTFLVKMPLEEAIRLQEVIDGEASQNNSYHYEQRTGKSTIVLDKDVRCGLMDDCNGGGSVFEIKLMKNVEIPVKALYRAVPDRGNGNYGFQEIYGMNDEEFEYALKEIREVVPEKVEDLISDAVAASEMSDKDSYGKEFIDNERIF